jgi:hypothetical protein
VAGPPADTSLSSAPADVIAAMLAEAVSSVCNVLVDHGCPTWDSSASGLAWHLFLARYYSEPIYCHADPLATELERAAYYGGRTEVLTWGRECRGTYCLDINSAYGGAMQCGVPCQLLNAGAGGPLLRESKLSTKNVYAIARVRIASNKRDYPVYHDGRTQFARGQYWTTLCGQELTAAADNYNVTEIAEWATYRTAPVLARYADGVWKARMAYRAEGDVLADMACKSLLVSLYGKFGQRRSTWAEAPDAVAWKRWGYWPRHEPGPAGWVQYRAAAGKVSRASPAGEWLHSFPAIAGAITSQCRLAVQGYVNVLGESNVHYYDTDAVHVDGAGWSNAVKGRMIDPTLLGGIKVRWGPEDMTYYGPNDYEGGKVRTTPCLPAGSVQEAPGTYYYTGGAGIASILDAREKQSVVLRQRIVTMRRERYNGRVSSEGRVAPLRIEEA